jgi:cytochrome b involved in lipid metabolism
VSLFRDKHPGGREILHYAAGKDITPLFEVNHGGRQLQLLQKFYVGRLVGKDHPGFPIPDAFSVTVKSVCGGRLRPVDAFSF